MGGKIYKECWNGRQWADRIQLHCEKYQGRDRCWDPAEQEWEWENHWEQDGTLDGSMLTSIETDGRIETSASNGNIIVEDERYSTDSEKTLVTDKDSSV